MKRFMFYLLTAFLFGSSSAFAAGLDSRSESSWNGCTFGGKRFLYPESKPGTLKTFPKTFTGKVECFVNDGYDSKGTPKWGPLKARFTVKNGLYDGTLSEYNDQGKLESEMQYQSGKRTGWTKKFDEATGKIISESQFVNDNHQGLSREYEQNPATGKLLRVYFMKPNGDMDTEINWHPNGKLKSIKCGENPVIPEDKTICGRGGKPGVAQLYDEKGKLSETITYVNGKRNGPRKVYGADGKVTTAENYKNDKLDGKASSTSGGFAGYDKSESQLQYKDGKRNGIEKTFFDDKKTKTMTYWKDDEVQKVVQFYQNGKKKVLEEVKGGLMFVIQYYDNGKPHETGVYKVYLPNWHDRKRHGKFKTFNENGKLWEVENYEDGQQNGTSLTYYDNGKVRSKEEFKKGVRLSRKEFDEDGRLKLSEEYNPDGSRK
jgi:antitoxin component YwqK of YwqJK toxin-antitoxin module